MSRPTGLGRGLGALIPTAEPGQDGLRTVSLNAIRPNPRQPRGVFDEQGIDELAASLRAVGMVQPIVVRPVEAGFYEIIAGERRYRAARRAALDPVPVVVRHTDDANLLVEALVENLHRADLNPLEEAAAYQHLRDDFGVTHEQLADRLGKSRPSVTNALRLLTLAAGVQRHLAAGTLSAGHARALLGVDDLAMQERLADRVLAEGLSVRTTEALVRKLGEEPRATPETRRAEPSPLGHLERRLSEALSTRVKISGSARRGRVVVDYSGQEDLERLLGILGRGVGEDLSAE
ncbi:MAG TPA: ParB/RepB/Spo0J family partition protein [Cryptosporangiaceae bacterium]|nr:ParB/RepB/Spo0J family partition protein [Cryptosporangiaceae bacterium]